MYRINDKKAAIREIQRYLSIISQDDPMLPHVTVDGFFGDETMIAVTEFQRKRDLAVTGKVDRRTFDMLFAEYTAAENAGRAGYKSISGGGTYAVGSSGPDVGIINLLITELSEYYDSIVAVSGDFFTRETEEALKQMQGILGYEASGTADEELISELWRHILQIKALRSK